VLEIGCWFLPIAYTDAARRVIDWEWQPCCVPLVTSLPGAVHTEPRARSCSTSLHEEPDESKAQAVLHGILTRDPKRWPVRDDEGHEYKARQQANERCMHTWSHLTLRHDQRSGAQWDGSLLRRKDRMLASDEVASVHLGGGGPARRCCDYEVGSDVHCPGSDPRGSRVRMAESSRCGWVSSAAGVAFLYRHINNHANEA